MENTQVEIGCQSSTEAANSSAERDKNKRAISEDTLINRQWRRYLDDLIVANDVRNHEVYPLIFKTKGKRGSIR